MAKLKVKTTVVGLCGPLRVENPVVPEVLAGGQKGEGVGNDQRGTRATLGGEIRQV